MAVRGTLADLKLVDVIRAVCVESRSAELAITARDGGAGGLVITGGEILHAWTGAAEGPDALYELLTWQDGFFSLREGARPAPRSVGGHWRTHLLAAMTRLEARQSLAASGVAGDASGAAPARGGQAAQSWVARLASLPGVAGVVVAAPSGERTSECPAESPAVDCDVTALVGGAAREIGHALALGSLARVSVIAGGATRLVFARGDGFVGLRLSGRASVQQVGARAAGILGGGDGE